MSGLTPDTLKVTPGGVLRGQLRVPGDKSVSHRAVLLGALAEGTTRIHGFLDAADTRATADAVRALGVKVTAGDPMMLEGAGLDGWLQPDTVLDLGNSGTGLRLLVGLLAGQPFDAELTGDASLCRRPMERIVEPLAAMGADIHTRSGHAPLKIRGMPLRGIDYTLPVASAQVKSAVLLAGLFADENTTVTDPFGTRDHTERMLQTCGAAISWNDRSAVISGDKVLQGCEIRVPADLSSAAFFAVGAAITPGAEVVLKNVGLNPGRIGVLEVLQAMGADLDVSHPVMWGAEPVGDLRVRGGALKGVRVPAAWVPRTVDEYPVLFVAAACADGTTVFEGLAELRVKESDRITVMAGALRALGVDIQVSGDTVTVTGGGLQGGLVDSGGDHRCAMALVIAGLRAAGPVTVTHCRGIDTSYPGFAEDARGLGVDLSEAPRGG
jgi:3-phosphoshikimate 1-carboxyvinyltransferase